MNDKISNGRHLVNDEISNGRHVVNDKVLNGRHLVNDKLSNRRHLANDKISNGRQPPETGRRTGATWRMTGQWTGSLPGEQFLGKSALQILPIVITPVSRSARMCVCVCLSLFYIRICSQETKILKKSTILIRTFLVEWHKSRFSTPWPWPSFARSKFLPYSSYENISSRWEIEQILLLTSDRKLAFAIEWRYCECYT